MRYSTTIFLFEEPLSRILEWLVDAGFDAVDIPGEVDAYPPKLVLDELGPYSGSLDVGEVTGVWGSERDLVSPDRTTRARALEYAKSCIRMAHELGSNLTHVCFMTNPHNLDNTPREKLLELAASATKECYDYAREYGVTLMIEPLYEKDVTPVNRAEQAVDVWCRALGVGASELASRDLGLLLDLFHMHHEEPSIPAAFEKYGDLVRHVHVADAGRGIEFKGDTSFVEKAFRSLEAMNYGGLVSFEPIPVRFDPGVDLKHALGKLKEFEKQAFSSGR
ncbi:MAG: sugar phosphate isomerase/epimerase family protein [Promethearchaeota archaeon]